MWYEEWLSCHTSLVSAQFRFRVIIVTFDLCQQTVWTSVSLLFLVIQWSGSDNGPSWTCTGPNWSQPSAFYCLYNSSPVEGLHSKLWNELERTMWVTTLKANMGHFVRWGKQPICMGTDHHIWVLELMSMWLNALFDHPEGFRNFLFNITNLISTSVNTVNKCFGKQNKGSLRKMIQKGCIMINLTYCHQHFGNLPTLPKQHATHNAI